MKGGPFDMNKDLVSAQPKTPENERLLNTWLKLSTTIQNSRLVSELSYNESLICNLLYTKTKSGLSMTATELCEFTKMLKSQMNRTLNILEEKNLIMRERSTQDKRRVMIRFNMLHAEAYEKQHKEVLKFVDHVIAKLSPQETSQAIALLSKIAKIADEL